MNWILIGVFVGGLFVGAIIGVLGMGLMQINRDEEMYR